MSAKRRKSNIRRSKSKRSSSLQRLIVIVIVAALGYFGVSNENMRPYVDGISKELADFILGKEGSSSKTVLPPPAVKKNEILKGKIIRVSDGDTVTLLTEDGNKYKIRLFGIDAPEIGQKFGDESRDFVKRMIYEKNVRIEVDGVDMYQRVLGIIHIGNINVNETLLKEGLAWQYHYNKDKYYADLVTYAKLRKKNIWSDPRSIDPYDWRKQNKK